jgi:hypothetical protein
MAGNNHQFTSPAVNIDMTPPVTTATASGLQSGGTYTALVTVSLAATDTMSGVANSYYTLDGAAKQTYSAPFAISGNGTHAITYWSVDKAGNAESAKTLSLNLAVPAPSYHGGLNFLSSYYDYPGVSLDTLFGYKGVKLSVWSPINVSYFVTPNGTAGSLRLGVGYWARLPRALMLSRTGTLAPTNVPFTISLPAGWNMIGDPFPESVPLASTTFGAGTTFAQATSGQSPLILSTVWAYSQSTNGYVAATSLDPLQGYWIYAYSATTMNIPAP